MGDTDGSARYWAFVSYSHKDAAFGRRLHRRLENYAIPAQLVGHATSSGQVPRKLAPIFRDREELPAAHDLTTEVRAALAASRSLIVVCSPAAAASQWVAREVEVFRALHPERPVLAAVCKGEPHDAFPQALYRTGAGGTLVEPLAADFRRGSDGGQLGLLKLIAGVLGIGLDELVQRDARRRTRRVTAVTAGALATTLAMGVLTLFAVNARLEAERQRAEAQRLVKFMYTDLHDALQGVGRLDLMQAVNSNALEYYDHQRRSLSAAARAQRAQVLRSAGDDASSQGHDADARARFEEAWRDTAALLAETPNSSERIFDHAQSEAYLGIDDYGHLNNEAARAHFLKYNSMAERLAAMEPHNSRYLREVAYAEGNLCSLYIRLLKRAKSEALDSKGGLAFCQSALTHMQNAARQKPRLSGIEADLSNRESWLGSAYRANGDDESARKHWQVQETILKALLREDPLNMGRRIEWVTLQRLYAPTDAERGNRAKARERLSDALTMLDEMTLLDPGNKYWASLKEKVTKDLASYSTGK